jgi:para-aminobenzoate synthetase/4-amino-4-deoxychorismate lyase
MSRWHSPPAELYELVERTPGAVLLECATESEAESAHPYTRLFLDPIRISTARQPSQLPQLFAEIESAIAAGYFAAGYFTYECGTFFEPTVALRPLPDGQPLVRFGIYDRVHCFDHRTGDFLEGDPPGLLAFRTNFRMEEPPADVQIESTLCVTEEHFAERIGAIHEWIRAGDVYQLNYTVPLRVQAPGSMAALYQHLRNRQPAPYCAFLHTEPNHRILSFSPELFFRIDNNAKTRRITTKPMKGTAPRGRTTGEDAARAKWLRNDSKNRSENVMIVDLLRNDLGRICTFGSVRADSLFAVERYPTLWQMTSAINGELRPEVDFQQIFRALFPCGSITGAPKVRAMQLLATIEEQPRGVYTGAIGFFSREQTVFSVAIRTLELDGGDGKMGVGSGIVIDSDGAGEFRECLLKAEFLTRSAQSLPQCFSLVETMLWKDGFPLIELHLDRFEDSAHYFAFRCDRAAIKASLKEYATGFFAAHGTPSRKVRLLLHSDGTFHIIDELLPDSPTPARVRIAAQRIHSSIDPRIDPRIDPSNAMYFHKTTHRPVYAEALKAATQLGYDDVIFMNLRGEVTEGAIHNIFVEKNGRLFTPPIECGLLPGVYRRHMLETHPNLVERILHLEDVLQADAVYITNAVRGLRAATVTLD